MSRKYSFSTDKDSDIIHSPLERSEAKQLLKHLEQSWDHTNESRQQKQEQNKNLIQVPLYPSVVELKSAPSDNHKVTIAKLPQEKKSSLIK